MTASPPVYCDYNATSPLRPSACAAMREAMERLGNPSSVHSFGRVVRHAIEQARANILQDLGLPGYRLVFTSGATEALATALTPLTSGPKPDRQTTRAFIAASDHVAALQSHGFSQDVTTLIEVNAQGLISLEQLKSELETMPEGERALVCVHAANNETGVLQPIEAISTLCDVHGALFVCDMVQLAGRGLLGSALPAIAIVSGHKVGGPAGVGALIYDPQRAQISHPLIRGGGQERGVRAGTENHIGIVGFAAALREATGAMQDEQSRLVKLRDGFEAKLLADCPDIRIFGRDVDRLANTSCFALPGHTASLALMQLDLAGYAISSGSACSSGKVKQSHVLQAMGIEPNLAECALRVSFGFGNNSDDPGGLLQAFRAGFKARSASASLPPAENSKKSATFVNSPIGNFA